MKQKQIEICKEESNLHNRIYHLKTLGKDCEMIKVVGSFYLYRVEREFGSEYYLIEPSYGWDYWMKEISLDEIKNGIRFINGRKVADLCEYVDDLWELDPVPTRSNEPRLCV